MKFLNLRTPHSTPVLAALAFGSAIGLAGFATLLHAAGDLSRQDPITVTVDLGSPGKHAFLPDKLRFETGKLYKLVLRNSSNDPHYFTSHAFSAMVWTRKAQVTLPQGDKVVTLAEFKGPMREIEVYPRLQRGMVVRAGRGRARHRSAMRHSSARRKDPAEQGMTGEIVIE